MISKKASASNDINVSRETSLTRAMRTKSEPMCEVTSHKTTETTDREQ